RKECAVPGARSPVSTSSTRGAGSGRTSTAEAGSGARSADAEERQARFEALDPDRDRRAPVVAGDPVVPVLHRLAARAERVLVHEPVAELLRDSLRREVVHERAGMCSAGAEAAERELQYCRSLLGSQPLSLVGRSEPRAGADLAGRAEAPAVEALRA